MNTSKKLFAACTAITALTTLALGLVPVGAQTPGAALYLGVIQPSPGYGTTSTYNVAVSVGNKPSSRTRIFHWFSGQHGVESYHRSATTNTQGVATFLDAIPSNWKKSKTWVDLNVACPTLGIQQHWRVKN